jgi:hypothetical protein
MSSKLDRDTLLQTLAGYAETNAIAEAERRARLAAMTDAQARAIFDDLCATGYHLTNDDGDRERLNHWRIEQKIMLRRALDQVAWALQQ